MVYIACKPVRFDRDYMIGEEIPGHVISPDRAAAIVGMGLIKRAESAQNPAQDVSGIDGVNGHVEHEDAAEGEICGNADASERPAKAKKTRGRKKVE